MPLTSHNFTGLVALFDGGVFHEQRLAITQVGMPAVSWWGLEHAAILQGAALSTSTAGVDCFIIEAGAHQGTLAILASKLGCTCHAFEASHAHTAAFRSNMALNTLPQPINLTEGFIGSRGHGRIDRHVSSTQHVTLLKMDIDGMDLAAMRGADRLFASKAVQYINLEYNPRKQKQAGSGAEYLRSLDEWGFDLWLYSCTPNQRVESNITNVLGSGRCLTYGNYGRNLHLGHGVWPYTETHSAERFVRCLFRLPGKESSINISKRRHPQLVPEAEKSCESFERSQAIPPGRFEDFAATAHEVDLVGRLRHVGLDESRIALQSASMPAH